MYIHTMEYYTATKKDEIMQFEAKWMDREVITLREMSQIEKDKYHMTTLINRN